VQIRVQRFRRQEQQRTLRRLAGPDVFARDIVDVAADIGRHAPQRLAALRLAGSLPPGAPALQRKFGVHRDRPGRKRQMDQRIATQPIRQRVLPGIRRGRQPVRQQLPQLPLPQRAPCLLVAEDRGERGQLPAQLRLVAARGIHHREPLLHPPHALGRGFETQREGGVGGGGAQRQGQRGRQ